MEVGVPIMDIQKILDEQRKLAEESGLRKSDAVINKTIANREKAEDEDFQRRRREKICDYNQTLEGKNSRKIIGEKNSKSSTWRENRLNGFLKVSQTEEYRDKRRKLQQENVSNPKYLESVSDGLKKFYQTDTGKETLRIRGLKRGFFIFANGVIYNNINEASAAFGIHPDTFKKRFLDSDPENYFRLKYDSVERLKLITDLNEYKLQLKKEKDLCN